MLRLSGAHLALAGVGLAAVIAGCGGSGTSSVAPETRVTPSPTPSATPVATQTPSGQTAPVTYNLTVPTSVLDRRTRKYISPSTMGISITAYASTATPPAQPSVSFSVAMNSNRCKVNATDGSRTCTGTVNAPVGTDDFTVTAYDQPPSGNVPQGNVLSTGSVYNQAVKSGSTKQLNVVLGGVIAALSLAPPDTITEIDGLNHTYSIAVNALDADKNYIIGFDPFANKPTVSVLAGTDPNNTLTIATPAPSADPHTFYINYNGGQLSQATIVASAPNVSTTASADVRALDIVPQVFPVSSPAVQGQTATINASLPNFEGPYYAYSNVTTSCEVTNEPPSGYYATSPGAPVAIQFLPLVSGNCIIYVEAAVLTGSPPTPFPSAVPTPLASPGTYYASYAVTVNINPSPTPTP
jgi:hypothetical protein